MDKKVPSDEEVNALAHEIIATTGAWENWQSLARRILLRYGKPAKPSASVTVDFDQVGRAGPFPVVDGCVFVPAETVVDLVRMAQPAASAELVRVRDESQPIYLDGVECQYSIEKGDPWPYSETVAYVFEREDAELIAAALNAAPVSAQPSLPVGIAAPAGPMYPPGKTLALFDSSQVPPGERLYTAPIDPANDAPTPEEEEAWQRMERRS